MTYESTELQAIEHDARDGAQADCLSEEEHELAMAELLSNDAELAAVFS